MRAKKKALTPYQHIGLMKLAMYAVGEMDDTDRRFVAFLLEKYWPHIFKEESAR